MGGNCLLLLHFPIALFVSLPAGNWTWLGGVILHLQCSRTSPLWHRFKALDLRWFGFLQAGPSISCVLDETGSGGSNEVLDSETEQAESQLPTPLVTPWHHSPVIWAYLLCSAFPGTHASHSSVVPPSWVAERYEMKKQDSGTPFSIQVLKTPPTHHCNLVNFLHLQNQ